MSTRLGVALLIGVGLVGAYGCGDDNPSTTAGTAASSAGASGAQGGEGGEGAQGGQGASGGQGGCTSAADCPGADGPCQTRTCADGECGFDFVPDGTPSSEQTAGDCTTIVCDGSGSASPTDDDTDVLDDAIECTDDTCSAGSPVNTPKAAGTECAQGVCATDGTCVECLEGADCASGICDQNVCVPGACTDAVKNGDETDVDCGGAVCAPCADGLVCLVASDCTSGVCAAGICQVPTCSDTVENGGETDVDCGSVCPGQGCGPGDGCTDDADCKGGDCSGTICLDSCTDVVMNQDETDIDCGGTVCTTCDDFLGCLVGGDCTSGVCTGGVCQPPVCGDGVVNGGDLCDDANTASGDGCDSSCLVEPGYVCMGSPSVCVTVCGDGIVAGAEACDDSNTATGDGCDGVCTVEVGFTCGGSPSVCSPICGDGLVVGTEPCDDQNMVTGDGCASCTLETGWTCAGQPSVCLTICGDGLILGPEICDDGNSVNADGCSACAPDPGWVCSGEPSVCNQIQIVTVGPGLNATIVDNGYTGAITAPSMTCVNIPVPATTANTVGSVTVQLGMNHSWVGDLAIKLVSPASTVITLMSIPGLLEPLDNGANGSGFSANLANAFPVTFVTGAATSAESMGVTLTTSQVVCQANGICSFNPNAGAATPGDLTTLVGQASNGTWQLCVGDAAGGDLGAIDAVTLSIIKQ